FLISGIHERPEASAVQGVGCLPVDRHAALVEAIYLRDLSRRGAKRRKISNSPGSNGSLLSWPASVITRAYRARTAAVALTSPCSDFATSDLINARCLLTLRVRPSSRIVICSPSSAARSVARLRLPLGRPLGLPDRPGRN